MGAHKKLQIQIFLQQIDLFDDCRGGNKQFLRSFVEATAFRYTQEGFQLRVIHGKYHSFLFCFFLNQQAFAPPWESSRTG